MIPDGSTIKPEPYVFTRREWLAGLIGLSHFPDRNADHGRGYLSQDRSLARIHRAGKRRRTWIDGTDDRENQTDQPIHMLPHWLRGTLLQPPGKDVPT